MTNSPGWTLPLQAVASRHRRLLAAAVTAGLAFGGLFAGAAGAKGGTLRFYQVDGPTQFYNASGKPINVNPPATLPKPGDSFDETDLDYAGTAKHHSGHWTASDHLTCTFKSSGGGKCDFQIAIGGSLLIGNNFRLDFDGPTAVAPISEGTGAFHDVHGMLTDVDLPDSNNAILTINLS